MALQAHKQSYCISPLWQERCCDYIIAQPGPILPKATTMSLCACMCLCALILVCMFYDTRLPWIISEYDDSGEGMTRKLAHKVPYPVNQFSFLYHSLSLLLSPLWQGEPPGLMYYQQPLLTLEAGLLELGGYFGLMSFLFSVQERVGHPDTCHSACCPIKINKDEVTPFELEVVKKTEVAVGLLCHIHCDHCTSNELSNSW